MGRVSQIYRFVILITRLNPVCRIINKTWLLNRIKARFIRLSDNCLILLSIPEKSVSNENVLSTFFENLNGWLAHRSPQAAGSNHGLNSLLFSPNAAVYENSSATKIMDN
jgi:hypothetical protein